MNAPKILNKHHGNIPADAIYVGRGSRWGNPFIIGKDGTRDEVIEKYCYWILEQPRLMTALHELKGRDLICYCFPQSCHAEILLILANEY